MCCELRSNLFFDIVIEILHDKKLLFEPLLFFFQFILELDSEALLNSYILMV